MSLPPVTKIIDCSAVAMASSRIQGNVQQDLKGYSRM